jgi:hypothetical protein
MSHPMALPIWWIDSLYGETLAQRLDAQLRTSPDMMAIINHSRGRYTGDYLEEFVDNSGPEYLARTPNGPRVLKSPKPLLSGLDQSEHKYRRAICFSDTMGVSWRIHLHPDFVLVLDPTARKRGDTKAMEESGLLIMARPGSNHARLDLAQRLERMASDAAEIFSYAWEYGIHLSDDEDLLPLKGIFFPPAGR